jgi:predicted O-methyltransferase YrrM
VWNTVKLVGSGIFLEIGSYFGGTALHICNAIDDSHQSGAQFYCFDPFEKGGFESFRPDETTFDLDSFTDADYAKVTKFLSAKPNARVVQGFFPQAAVPFDLHNIAFCHLDVDSYEATLECLRYLAPRLAPRSVILVDDLGNTGTPGVRNAITYFLAQNPSFLLIEMFPLQGLLLSRDLW